MQNTRPTAVAGLFYPANPQELADFFVHELSHVRPQDKHRPLAIIAPHAGYIFSGAIAASVFTYLADLRSTIKRVLLIGPSHRVGFQGLALSSADYFTTPLGAIQLDKDAQEQLLTIPDIHIFDQAHANEHSIEVELPFLQHMLDDFSLVPIVAGTAEPELVEKVIETLWDAHETLVVISSDLSHYHDYQTAQHLDNLTSQAIVDLNYSVIHSANACGHVGINGLLLFAQKHQLTASIVDVRNSGDTAGDKSSVVGYGAYLFEKQNIE